MTTDYKDVVFTVYLANVFCEFEHHGIAWDQIDAQVIQDFGFLSEKQFTKTLEQFTEAFKQEQIKQHRK